MKERHSQWWASLLHQVTVTSLPLQRQKILLVASLPLQRHKKLCRLLRYRYKTNGELKCRSYVSVKVYQTLSLLQIILFSISQIFGQNNRKIFNIVGNTGAYFLSITCYFSPQIKFNGYIITVSNGLSRILTSYQDIKCTKPSRYSLHRYFPKHDF